MSQQDASLSAVGSVTPTMSLFIEEVRCEARRLGSPYDLGRAVAVKLSDFLTANLLDARHREAGPRGYRQHVLHAEANGSFSIVALIWAPGQETAIHDHLAWCVAGVLEGAETEITYQIEPLDESWQLTPVGQRVNGSGTVCFLQPPGDIHKVRNDSDDIAVSIHVYGCDVRRAASSIRRVYDCT